VVEGVTVTTVTWRQVEVGTLLVLLQDEPGDGDATFAAGSSAASDVIPLAASSSLTRAK